VTAALMAPGVAEQARAWLACAAPCCLCAVPCCDESAADGDFLRVPQLRASVARCAPRLDAAPQLPEELCALLREAGAADGAAAAAAAQR
jgi:hypothetical protein